MTTASTAEAATSAGAAKPAAEPNAPRGARAAIETHRSPRPQRMGVELDRDEAERWIAAMATEAAGGQIAVDVDSGVYGHRVTMADHQPRGPGALPRDGRDRRASPTGRRR